MEFLAQLAQTSSTAVPVQTTMSSLPNKTQAVPAVSLQSTLVPLTLKLDRNNFSIWRSLIIPAIRALGLEGFLNGSRACPERFLPN